MRSPLDERRAEYDRAFSLCFKEGRYGEARELLESLTAKGFAPGQAFLGWLYQMGRGVEKDRSKARELYLMAAADDYSVATYYLGVLAVEEGKPSEGIPWLQRAVAKGYAPALRTLGFLYDEGTGVKRDESVALRYWRDAAALGDPWAQREVARRLIRGRGGLLGIVQGAWAFLRIPLLAKKLYDKDPDSPLLHP